jgi:hypothetical protein
MRTADHDNVITGVFEHSRRSAATGPRLGLTLRRKIKRGGISHDDR